MHIEEHHATQTAITERFTRVVKCRVCSHPKLATVLDLGKQPLANPTSATSTEMEEEEFPLCLLVCPECFLAQLDVVVSPEVTALASPAFSLFSPFLSSCLFL
jgi:hypothetical protein